jgi:dTDP-4-amino-4,6-dideoxygalactose transaminase
MIPRYRPQIALGARLASFRGASPSDAIAPKLGLSGMHNLTFFATARAGLFSYFRGLAEQDDRRLVLLSAQICPAVPLTLLRAGFTPLFCDIDQALPTPSGRVMRSCFEAAGGSGSVAAIIPAVNYGHLPDFSPADVRVFKGSEIVLDLAQGVAMGPELPVLMHAAGAVLCSFGVGKGLDFGGGMLAQRSPNVESAKLRAGWRTPLTTLPSVLLLRIASATGLYRHLIRVVEGLQQADKTTLGQVEPFRPDIQRHVLFLMIDHFKHEVETARERAAILFGQGWATERLVFQDVYGSPSASHLRQVVRVRSAETRDEVVARLRSLGIDAAAAGEPLPSSYLAPGQFAGVREWLNAERFRADAIRLPFLGRLTRSQFDRVMRALEQALA